MTRGTELVYILVARGTVLVYIMVARRTVLAYMELARGTGLAYKMVARGTELVYGMCQGDGAGAHDTVECLGLSHKRLTGILASGSCQYQFTHSAA